MFALVCSENTSLNQNLVLLQRINCFNIIWLHSMSDMVQQWMLSKRNMTLADIHLGWKDSPSYINSWHRRRQFFDPLQLHQVVVSFIFHLVFQSWLPSDRSKLYKLLAQQPVFDLPYLLPFPVSSDRPSGHQEEGYVIVSLKFDSSIWFVPFSPKF